MIIYYVAHVYIQYGRLNSVEERLELCCTLVFVLFLFLLRLELTSCPLYKIDDEGGIYVAMVVYGKMNEYEDWLQYAEQVGHYSAANEIEYIKRKHEVLLTVVGAATYKLLCSHL